MIFLNLLMRWVHVSSAVTAVGATVFLRLVLIPVASKLSLENRDSLLRNLARPLQTLMHSAIGGLLVSGLYNLHSQWKSAVSPYEIVFTLKALLALVIFTLAFFLTSSKPQRAAFQANRKKWLTVNLVLAAFLIALSAYLKTLHQ